MCFTVFTLWELWLVVPKAGVGYEGCGTDLSGRSLYTALFETVQWNYNFLSCQCYSESILVSGGSPLFCWNRCWWGQLKWWYDGDEWHWYWHSPKKGQGCVESRIALFSCSTDLSWQKLIDVRSQVTFQGLWAGLWSWEGRDNYV